MAQTAFAVAAVASSISLPPSPVLGFLAIGALVIVGGALRNRYLRHDGGPAPSTEERIDCPRCGVQNRITVRQCQYCHTSLAD